MYIKLLEMNSRITMRLLINSKLTKSIQVYRTSKYNETCSLEKDWRGDIYGSSASNIYDANFIQFRSYSIPHKRYTSTKACHFNSTSNPVFLCHTRFHCTYYK